MMRKAGGIIALIAGIFGVIAAIATLMIAGFGNAVGAARSHEVVALGFGGILFSFIVIVLGALTMGARTKRPGAWLIVAAIVGVFLGGSFVAVFMVLALIGGILAVSSRNPNQLEAGQMPQA